MAPSATTKVFIAFFVAFCVFPMIWSSRVLINNESSDSRSLFHKLGSDFLEQEVLLHKKAVVDRGSPFRQVHSGPNPQDSSKPPTLRRNVPMDIGHSSFREVPTGPNSLHNSGPPTHTRLVV
ncbi:hypothetical protein Salat_0211700 [Sesamum alatum]|uniref:Uncharacterized protein n=1 Tax=Sesamum alatum TaxID=300844 RepID=A0AAE2CXZ4_9LAMI|nr:hypothetical protein Salat_0211700 [Sesamum alatum]